MREVIDSNFLQSDELKTYLAESTDNYVVMTDYVAMEAYKGDTLPWFYDLMELLSRYPKQVLVLKEMREVCGLYGPAAASQDSLIDETKTRDFLEFCQHLAAAKQGDPSLQRQLLENGKAATAHIGGMLRDMATLANGIDLMTKDCSPAELKILRRRDRPLPQRLGELIQNPQMLRKQIQDVTALAAALSQDDPSATSWLKLPEARDRFIFRFAICGYVSILMRIRDGGAGKITPEKLRNNDVIDVNIVAFATYFDGLLTADKRAAEIYEGAEFLLREVFTMSPWWLRLWFAISSLWARPASPVGL